jgi:hypothetical protein
MEYCMRKLLAFALLAAIAAPVVARPESSSHDQDPNRVICRSEPVIGSRLQSKRTCLTSSQWAQMERDQRDTVDRVQRSGQRPGQ